MKVILAVDLILELIMKRRNRNDNRTEKGSIMQGY